MALCWPFAWPSTASLRCLFPGFSLPSVDLLPPPSHCLALAASRCRQVALSSLWEYGQFDDIVQDSPSQASPVGDVAMLFSTAADIWDTADTVHKAAKRALYIALRHSHLSVDVLNEEDVTTNSTLNK